MGKLLLGELEAVNIKGKGLVMQKDLRTEELEVNTDSIAIDAFKAASGEIVLTQPTDASNRVILTEQDLERAFNAEYIQQKLQELEVDVDGQPVKVNTAYVDFHLPGEGKVAFSADITLVEAGETKQISFTAVPRISEDEHCVSLEDVQYAEGTEDSQELTAVLLESARELLDLRNFELPGMSLRFQELDVQKSKLTLQAKAYVEKFPGS